MACLVQSISHTPLWCFLLTMLIIPLSICRPSPSIIVPLIAVLLTREQFLKSLQTLDSFSHCSLLSGQEQIEHCLQAGSSLPGCLSTAKVPLPRSLSQATVHLPDTGGEAVQEGGALSHVACLQAPHTSRPTSGHAAGSLLLSSSHEDNRWALCFSQDFCPVPDSSVCAVTHHQSLFFRLSHAR